MLDTLRGMNISGGKPDSSATELPDKSIPLYFLASPNVTLIARTDSGQNVTLKSRIVNCARHGTGLNMETTRTMITVILIANDNQGKVIVRNKIIEILLYRKHRIKHGQLQVLVTFRNRTLKTCWTLDVNSCVTLTPIAITQRCQQIITTLVNANQ